MSNERKANEAKGTESVNEEVHLKLHLLVEKAQGGDEQAASELAEVLRTQLCIRFRSFGLNSVEAEDLAQHSVSDVIQSLPRFNPLVASVEAWTAGIAHNHFRSYYRKRVSRDKFEVLVSTVPDCESGRMEPFGLEFNENLELDVLCDLDQEILHLRFHCQLSFAEIGEQLGLAEGTARKRTSRSLKKLRSQVTCNSEVA